VCDVYTHTAAGCDFPPLAEGHTLPQGRIGRQQMWWATQDAIDPRTALIGLVTGMGAYYTKGDSDPTRADYDPAIDILHAGTGRGINTGMLLALHLVEGGCGASVYGMDNLEQRRQRMRETNPRTVFGEPLQTGFHPYGTGETGHIFRAVGAFKRCVDALGPARLFAPMGLAPSLGPGLVTSVRRTAQGDLLLIVNTREVEVTTAPLPMAGARMAHYTCGEEYSVTPVPAGEVRLALQPGAMVALVPVTEDGTEEVAG